MKTKTSTFAAFTLKAVFLLTCTVPGFVGFTKCNVQSVADKWKQVLIKYFFTAGGAQTIDKQFSETQMATPG